MRIVVLINLKPETDVAEYQEWVRTVDIPGVRSLSSCRGYEVLRATGLFGGGDAPYQYIEIIDVADPEGFTRDVGTEKVQALAAKLGEFAQDPVFIVSEPVE